MQPPKESLIFGLMIKRFTGKLGLGNSGFELDQRVLISISVHSVCLPLDA